ncbi:MAG: histidine--tRNA ligase [Candidatus Woesearchaeota archaeon]
MKLERCKGTVDFPPEQKIAREEIVSTLTKVFKKYGFDPLETPILERYDTLSANYAGGAEILKETFRLKDQGNRSLGLRYDLTVPLARFIAMNPQIAFPFKRYQIEKVFRDGPITRARIREFYQCDVDVVGSRSLSYDAELIQLSLDALKALKLKCIIKVNNRKLLNEIVDYAGIKKDPNSVILVIDKLYKIGKEGVEKELKELGLKEEQIKKITKTISVKGTNKEKLEKISKIINKEGIKELKEVLKYFEKDVEFDPTLARGLAYYTGTVFEIVLKNKDLGCSVGGGGRYDKMIGSFVGKGEIPATGISFGLEPLSYCISKLRKGKKTNTELFIIPIKTTEKSLKIAKKLRDSNINTDIDLNNRNISKNLNYANKKDIPYVLFIGEKELKQKKFKLRNMITGKEQLFTLEKLTKYLKN